MPRSTYGKMGLVPRLTRPSSMPREVQAAIDIIGNMARSDILRALATESLTGPELAARLGAERTSVHLHLRVLEEAGLVEADHPRGKRRGQTVRWSTRPDRLDEVAQTWLAYVRGD